MHRSRLVVIWACRTENNLAQSPQTIQELAQEEKRNDDGNGRSPTQISAQAEGEDAKADRATQRHT